MTRRVTHQSVCISKAVRERACVCVRAWCKVKLVSRISFSHLNILLCINPDSVELGNERLQNIVKISGIIFSEDEVGVSPCAVQPVFVRLLQQDAV